MTARVLDVARWLASSGARHSAARLLEVQGVSGREANTIMEEASTAQLPFGFYGLMVHDGVGLVVPIAVEGGHTCVRDTRHIEAMKQARQWVSNWLGVDLPPFRLRLEDFIDPDGDSLGLAAVLAAIAQFTDARPPSSRFLVTGAISGGLVGPVGQLGAKREASNRELAGLPGEMITPEGPLREIEDIVTRVFGPRSGLSVLLDFGLPARLERARALKDHEVACEQLEALLGLADTPADRALVLLELGNRLRHLGRSEEAQRRHDEALHQAGTNPRAIEHERSVELKIQRCATARDGYRLAEAEAELRTIWTQEGLSFGNEIQLRGTLAQTLAMEGRVREALEIRRPCVELHSKRADYRRDLPQTLCNLALDSARSGDRAGFDAWVAMLFSQELTETQLLYAFAALLRGLSFLRRWDDLLGVLESRSYLRHRVPPSLAGLMRGDTPVTRHPEVSVARAVAAALRHLGRQSEAISLTQRVQGTDATRGLVHWLALLAQGERALALRELGEDSQSAAVLAELRRQLPLVYEPATVHHGELLTCDWSKLEAALEASWY